MEHLRHVEAVALMSEVPRFTPSQWQRLFWDAGLPRATVHLFLRSAHQHSPWSMVVDTQNGVIDLEAFTIPVTPAMLGEATVTGGDEAEIMKAARVHGARIEVSATQGRCEAHVAHDLVARVTSGLLRTTYGIAWLHPASGILSPAAVAIERVKKLAKGQVPIEFYAIVRETLRHPTVVVDTLGLPNFDHADLEIEVDSDDAQLARDFVTNLASEIGGRSTALQDGTVLPGPLELRWRAAMATAAVPPMRAVMRFSLLG